MHERRELTAAGFGNIGGIIATYSFVKSDAPLYRKGYSICLSFICLSVVSCVAYAAAVMWENKKRSKQVHNLNLTESEKLDLGVSLVLGLVCEAILTMRVGSEPRIQVHAMMTDET